jgi:hypothetical protein
MKTRAQSPESNDPVFLRQLLANQPDYTAVQQFIFDEGFGGFGATSKVAKLGSRQREESDDRIFLYERGKPAIKIYPKRREYAEIPEQTVGDFTLDPEELAKRDNMVFKSLGMEKAGDYSCRNIEVSYKDKRLEGIKFVFCVAPELKNLVVMMRVLMKPVTMTSVLRNVRLGVSEDLFRVPPQYKKVIEKPYDATMKERLDLLEQRTLTPAKKRNR